MRGYIGGRPEFPQWLGNNSKRNKFDRLLQELQQHTRLVLVLSERVCIRIHIQTNKHGWTWPCVICTLLRCTYIHTYIIHTYTHTYTHSHIYIHTHIHTHIHTYIHTHIHIHTYIHTYIHTHTHTHNYFFTVQLFL